MDVALPRWHLAPNPLPDDFPGVVDHMDMWVDDPLAVALELTRGHILARPVYYGKESGTVLLHWCATGGLPFVGLELKKSDITSPFGYVTDDPSKVKAWLSASGHPYGWEVNKPVIRFSYHGQVYHVLERLKEDGSLMRIADMPTVDLPAFVTADSAVCPPIGVLKPGDGPSGTDHGDGTADEV